MPRDQLRAQFLQTLLAARDEDERARRVRQLPGKLAADSGRGAGDQRLATIESHHDPFFSRSGASTRQTFSATIFWPAAVG